MMIQSIKALTFDTGGTVLDWHSGVSAALASVGARRGVDGDWPAMANEYRRRALKSMTLSLLKKVFDLVIERRMVGLGNLSLGEYGLERARHLAIKLGLGQYCSRRARLWNETTLDTGSHFDAIGERSTIDIREKFL